MTQQVDLLQEINQKYVIDANALLDFWGSIGGYRRVYDVKVKKFREVWEYIAAQIIDGTIILPDVVYQEVEGTTKTEFHEWLVKCKKLRFGHEDALNELAEIVNAIDIYTTDKASLPDAIIIAIAKNRNLTVITSERRTGNLCLTRPKIPDVCEKFGVKWMSLPQYFALEKL